MQEFTAARGPNAPDELWLLEHPATFTLGQAGDPRHVLDAAGTPVLRTDRGGQATYHGPGQLVVYVLLNLPRLGIGVRALVTALEETVVALLARHGITGETRADAPGVYVAGAKLASLGLRVRRGHCYHGLSLNVAMDLEPFRRIHPCGQIGLPVTQLRDLYGPTDPVQVAPELVLLLVRQLGLPAIDPGAAPSEWIRVAHQSLHPPHGPPI
jgi:lipoyl(octanoyl) transferase